MPETLKGLYSNISNLPRRTNFHCSLRHRKVTGAAAENGDAPSGKSPMQLTT